MAKLADGETLCAQVQATKIDELYSILHRSVTIREDGVKDEIINHSKSCEACKTAVKTAGFFIAS